ncbi:MAG: peptidoglycan DD-metalloendopeptidase family protein [Nevskiaceae bacterium]
MSRRLLALLLTLWLAGCAELYRWPERMDSPAVRLQEQIPADGRHTVKPGDTMYSIAFRYKLDFRELSVWNDVGPDYLIHPGDVIRLSPPPGGTGASAPIRTAPLPPAGRAMPTPAPTPPPLRRVPPAEVVTAIAWRWPTAGTVAKPFNDGGKGIDIGGALGQPVLAAGAGKVVYSGSALKGYGELIIIKHDDVHLSAYGYNRRRLVDEGAVVAAGQPIAELGLGPEQKPMLHFEIRRRGKPVDPAGYLPRR